MRCENWTETGRCQNPATVWIIDPDKATVPGCRYCKACANETVRQYRELLGEEWGTISIDEHGYPAEAAYDKAVEELVIAWIESSAIIRERCPYEWAFITKALAPFLEKAKEGKS